MKRPFRFLLSGGLTAVIMIAISFAIDDPAPESPESPESPEPLDVVEPQTDFPIETPVQPDGTER